MWTYPIVTPSDLYILWIVYIIERLVNIDVKFNICEYHIEWPISYYVSTAYECSTCRVYQRVVSAPVIKSYVKSCVDLKIL